MGSMNLVAVLFVFGAVFNLINLFFTANAQLENPDVRTSAVTIVVGLVFVLLSIFVQAGSMGYVRDKIKAGQASLASFTSAGGKYYLRLLLIGLLVVLVILAFVLAGALVIAVFGTALSAVGIGIAIILAAVGIYVLMLMFLAPYLIVGEDTVEKVTLLSFVLIFFLWWLLLIVYIFSNRFRQTSSGRQIQHVFVSIKKSVSLVRKNLLSVLGIMVVLIAIGFAVGLVLGIVLALLSAVVKGTASQVIFGIVSSFVNAYLGVLVTSSFMHFYFNVAGNTANTSGAKS